MTQKHTPGPWYVSEEWAATNRYEIISKPQMVPVATVAQDVYDENDLAEKDQADANAHLIAAAPELLNALEMILDADGDLNAIDFNQIRAAIAKATGE